MTQAPIGPETTNYTSSEHREISRIGSVTIKLNGRELIKAAKFTVSSTRCRWFDHAGTLLVEQSFTRPRPIPWRHAAQHEARTVTFVHHDMQASQISVHEDSTRSPTVSVQYIFHDADSYKEFQGHLREGTFIAEYETERIDVSAAEYTEDQCIKFWENTTDDGQRTLTLPVTFSNRKVRQQELQLTWLVCERANAKTVKLHFKRSERKNSRVCDEFIKTFTSASRTARPPSSPTRPSGTPESPTLIPKDRYPLNTPANLLASSGSSTAPSIGSDSWTSKRTASSTTSSEAPSQYATALLIDRARPSAPSQHATTLLMDRATPPASTVRLPEPLVHEYWRQGGPRSMDAKKGVHQHRQLLQDSFYEPLTGAEDFRILRLSGGTSNRIKCRLERRNLSEVSTYEEAYEALSYCWGESTALKLITIDRDQEVPVSSHLWDALRRLRLPKGDRLLWVDAVCINQNNVSEKNRQILLMRRIYQNAHRTVVWIGNLDSVEATCQRLFRPDGESKEASATLCTRQGLPAFEHEDVSHELGKVLQELHDNIETKDLGDIWWKRLWCVQEFHFSARPPSVYIGPHAISWQHFSSLFQQDSDPLYLFRDLGTPSDQSLFKLLSMTGRSRCGDPRDRIYSLLGMTTTAAHAIRPDYRKSILRVVEEACLHLVKASGTLDVLVDGRVDRKYWGRETLYAVMPTWVPELTSLPEPGSVESKDHYNAGPGREDTNLRDSESAEDATEPIDADYDMPRALSMQAVYFDKIVARTTEADIRVHEHSRQAGPEVLIYNSLFERGHLLDDILKVLDYEFDAPKGARRDRSPCIGFLLLDYLFEGKRSVVSEFDRRAQGPERDVTEAYKRQRQDDIHYAERKGASQDIEYVNKRWQRKINNAANDFVFTPERLVKALATGRENIRQDFHIAREFENLFAYARKTKRQYYFTGHNFDAPMRADVLKCKTRADVRRLDTQYDATEDPEFHEYNEKNRKRDFFRTESGFLGMGPSSLAVGDVIVMPFGASRPFILRKCEGPGDKYHHLIGEAVLPRFMSGGWVEQQKDTAREYLLK